MIITITVLHWSASFLNEKILQCPSPITTFMLREVKIWEATLLCRWRYLRFLICMRDI